MAQESYHTQHAPFGAFASFTVGLVDSQGGFGQSLGVPARQNVYVGFRSAQHARWQMLPFLNPPVAAETAFTAEDTVPRPPGGFDALRPAAYQRTLNWASDTWRADESRFGFSLLTPFDHVADPAKMKKSAARFQLAPAIFGWIEYDNRAGTEPVELMFGIGDPSRPLRPLSEADPKLVGFAGGTGWGYATAPTRGIELRQGFDVFAPKFRDYHGLLVIAAETALVFSVPAGRRKRFPLVLGFYAAGTQTTGLPASYAYTRVFDDLEDVLKHGLEHFDRYAAIAATRDRELDRSRLNPDQRFLLAQSTHSYYGSTQLLWDKRGPLWMVNEGEYRMINTFDLTVDHVFFELAWHPWAVRDVLDLFVRRYSYRDRHGLAFTHDMGVMNHFTMPGRSSYECDHLTGCFSHMTMEQLLNWVLTAVTYASHTEDRRWLKTNLKTLLACAESLHVRDDADPKKRDGILKRDSDRCGADGSEITTYDSLDVSLGQARNNLYLAVKTLGAWVLLERAFGALGQAKAAGDARATADRLAQSITQKFEHDTGFFPAVFEKGNRSRILPAVEGFIYPLYLGYTDATNRTGRFAPLFRQLGQHMAQALQPGICLDAKSGGWKMSSTSTNTWFSKIAIAQHVVRQLFPEVMNDAARAGDRVHADWQRTPGCGRDAMCDQIRSDSGVACGSRYYPRGVSCYLWLSE
ncbi:glycoside hydrolase family 52 protein [Opitutus terrae]|uniref:Xylan 1,4-beta-xylosidase n=1 Tax=Opitutus terrae (strain DSM 11246 / JCM 15787 / PB90-1) TaxID=452637 RepID=B1ZP95_OPITP|nr:glycoside hydrolase family 52 protein [Opitutus terrae]ACB77584.1 Xylan 1,4-beta-xylosidase [Opitutus terrae PB90-1]